MNLYSELRISDVKNPATKKDHGQVIVGAIVNIFVGSSALQFAISVIGVLIFAGLTVYDTQAIKGEYVANARAGNEEWMAKSAIMGALRLYLDFINLFTFLLQFMGDRR